MLMIMFRIKCLKFLVAFLWFLYVNVYYCYINVLLRSLLSEHGILILYYVSHLYQMLTSAPQCTKKQ